MSRSFPAPLVFNGINLDNYFPNQRSYNSVVYVHKRFLTNPQDLKKDTKKGFKQNVTKSKQTKTDKIDKGIQFDGVINEPIMKKSLCTNTKTDTDMINHTVQFAKKIFPLIIPYDNYDDPYVFTVKTKKTKKKPKEYAAKNLPDEKNKTKKNNSPRRTKFINNTEIFSAKESVSHLSQNTLDDFNLNESLSCTISGISEKKYVKKDKDYCNLKKNDKKMAVSNSLEALATEMLDVNEGANIKIHLMNEADKNIFSESLQIPIINAIKECITELNQYDRIGSQFKEVQRFIECNNEKLNVITDKISSIERQIGNQMKKRIEVIKSPIMQASKSSKLEQLGEDLEELSDNIYENESTDAVKEKKMYESKSVIATLDKIKTKDEKRKFYGGGETSSPLSTVNEVAIKPDLNHDRPNRIPTRFCWTDAGRS
ncbi:uncharacterized protein LOC128677611 [Plodia interpunctella]|uniref:uncharacterized protein LOC128677611 n=1 Tax=Plodia interpunctella TaxID=58824 RepID=UPI00236799BA|nr:uncharacterized protein LOC128677611 [Plodia interpunctella]